MASTISPTTATHTSARLASKRNSGLAMLVGLARLSNPAASSGSVSAIVRPCRFRLPVWIPAQLGAQRGPGTVGAQGLEPAQRIPSRVAVEREGDEFGTAANARDRNRSAEPVADRSRLE